MAPAFHRRKTGDRRTEAAGNRTAKKTRFSGIGVEDQMSFVFLTKVAIMVNESIE